MPPAHATKRPEAPNRWNTPEDTKRLHLLSEAPTPRSAPNYRITVVYISIVLTAIFLLLLVDSFR